jgi:hypothetical protein
LNLSVSISSQQNVPGLIAFATPSNSKDSSGVEEENGAEDDNAGTENRDDESSGNDNEGIIDDDGNNNNADVDDVETPSLSDSSGLEEALPASEDVENTACSLVEPGVPTYLDDNSGGCPIPCPPLSTDGDAVTEIPNGCPQLPTSSTSGEQVNTNQQPQQQSQRQSLPQKKLPFEVQNQGEMIAPPYQIQEQPRSGFDPMKPSEVPVETEPQGYLGSIQPADSDGDGIANKDDNCPFNANIHQEDFDGDGIGDACMTAIEDFDRDGIKNPRDNCPMDDNPDQKDSDFDGEGDKCDPSLTDSDRDGLNDAFDNCDLVSNSDQKDKDADGLGDVCDPDLIDTDKDGVVDSKDNCPTIPSADQKDTEFHDGIGDVCQHLGGGQGRGGGVGSP